MTSARGFSLLETVFALSILLVVALGLLPLGALAVGTTENQGHLEARVTEYAQDKLEQLMALAYGDSLSDTRVFPATTTGGSGLVVGGSLNLAAPVDAYSDYLDINGSLVASVGGLPPAAWFYKRQWQVEQASVNLKRISVTATTRTQVGRLGRIPITTVVLLKTSPF